MIQNCFGKPYKILFSMAGSSDDDDDIFDPRAGLRKSLVPSQINCDESIALTCSTVKSNFNSKLKSKLSLSQRKRETLEPSQVNKLSLFDNKNSPPHTIETSSHLHSNGTDNSSDASQKNPKKRPRREVTNSISSSDNDVIFPSQSSGPKKILRRSDKLIDSKAVSPKPSASAIVVSPIKCRKGKKCPNSSAAHRKAYNHMDSSESIETIASSVISLIIPDGQLADGEISNKLPVNKNKNESNLSFEEQSSAQISTFSTSGQTKEDFVQHWVDSCELDHSLPLDDEDTQPLPEAASSLNRLLADIPEPILTENLFSEPVEEDTRSTTEFPSVATTLSKNQQTDKEEKQTTIPFGGMVTPVKNSTQPKPSTSGSKQTAITAFFTPRSGSSQKSVTTPPADISKVQKKTRIDELSQTSEIVEEQEVITMDQETTTSSSRVEPNAKDQWSYIMSRMNMRGTASTVQHEIKQAQIQKATNKPVVNKKESNDAGPERKCPFYKLIPNTGFAIDAFCYGKVKGVTSYFLSHFHYDHYRGLGKWLDKPLYCSQVTANLVNLKIKPNPSLIRVLPLNESRVIENVEVVLLDANHCPGSVMFLFRFPTGKAVLHVGDFRAHRSMETIKELQNRPIDHLYLDTTYCDEHYELPSQEEVLAYVARLVRRYTNKHSKLLVVSGTYTIGKEKVFMKAAEELNSKVWAPTEKRRILNCLEDLEISSRLARDPLEARIHVVNMGDLNPANLKKYLDSLKGSFTHILALKPTGWEYDGQMAMKGLDSIPPKTYHNTIFIQGVPYSEHSGFTEMERFVRHFQPRRITPTVNIASATQRQKMESIFTKWLGHSARF